MNGNGGVITGMLDHRQVKTLYEQHGRVLLAYAVSLLPDRAASEDVLHQVFVKLLQGKACCVQNSPCTVTTMHLFGRTGKGVPRVR